MARRAGRAARRDARGARRHRPRALLLGGGCGRRDRRGGPPGRASASLTEARPRSVTTDRVPAVLSRRITVRAPRGRRGAAAGLLAGAVVVVVLAGCETKQGNEDLVSGKQMFVAKC